jgi:hypothetical protein
LAAACTAVIADPVAPRLSKVLHALSHRHATTLVPRLVSGHGFGEDRAPEHIVDILFLSIGPWLASLHLSGFYA